MRFIHLSDTHLGYQHLGINERKQDFFDAFKYVVDYALENDVDFIIHTGDFFHTSRPSNETIIDAISLLKRLKDKNIPIYVIPGNHDRGSGTRDKTALDILREFGINQLERDFTNFEDINIFGIKYIQKSLLKEYDMKSILQQLYEKAEKRDFNILMLHMEFKSFFYTDLDLVDILPDGFNYVGIGHYHQAQKPFDLNSSKVVYSGSTEYTQFNEKDYSEKIFYVVDLENPKSIKITPIKIPARKFIIKRFNDDNLDTLIDDLKNCDLDTKKPVVILRGTTKSYLTKRDILDLIKEKKIEDNFLHIIVDIERTTDIDYEFKYIVDNQEKKNNYILETVEKNITDSETKEKILKLLEMVNTFENLEEMERFITDNPDYFKL